MTPNPTDAAQGRWLLLGRAMRKVKSLAMMALLRPQDEDITEHIRLKHRAYFADASYDFFSLPVELRTTIYKLLTNANNSKTQLGVLESGRIKPRQRSSQLLRTCKIIYEEFLPQIYASKQMTATSFHHFHGGLRVIGSFACNFIEHLVMSNSTVPQIIAQSNKRELRALGIDCEPGMRTMPLLPNLKTVTLRYEFVDTAYARSSQSPPTTIEELMKRFLQMTPGHGNILRSYMRSIGDRQNVIWKVEVAWAHIPELVLLTGDDDLDELWKERLICAEIKLRSKQEGKRQKWFWEFQDGIDGSKERLALRSRSSTSPEWQAIKEIPLYNHCA